MIQTMMSRLAHSACETE
uniref:Uncharacterized protein n=1 Tax=Anguilla anguilla TaxID=7936 RepID=A0A0E9VBV6_ANGAN